MKKYYFSLIFFLNTIALGNLLQPINGDELNYIHILFEWDQEPDAVGYNLQVSPLQSFNNLILDIDEISTVYIDTNHLSWDDTYYWRARPILDCDGCDYGNWIGIADFQIGEPIFQNLEISLYDEDLLEDGYVAIGAFSPNLESVIIDKYGNEIWNDGGMQMQLNHINKYGNIYGFSINDYPLHTGMKANTDMDVVWSTMDSDDPVDSHIIKQLPNGNYMGFIRVEEMGPIPNDNYMTQYFQLIGYQANGVTPEFTWFGQMIVEWNEGHEVVWTWNPFDHFTMADYDNYEGTWYGAYFNQEHDWMHSNAFHFDDEESVIYVSHRHLSRISKIAYPSGEVIWNMGLPAEYMASGDEHICTDLLFSFQHNIQLMDNGDLLFFDNGNLSDMLLGDSNPTTRIRRIKVIDNSYCETVWQYDLPQNLHGLGMGSVQELNNGNYSIYTFGSGLNNPECSVIEITPDNEIIWKATGNNNSAWYRAYKIPELHPNAFSVVAYGYTVNEEEKIIEMSGNTLDFKVFNKSGYLLKYKYIFSDLLDAIQLFIYEEGEINIEPYSSVELSFSTNSDVDISSTNVILSIWPHGHEYAVKELQYTVVVDSSLLGDTNADGILNILDIVLLVNMVLSGEFNSSADLNTDDVVNILDVVALVNIILGS